MATACDMDDAPVTEAVLEGVIVVVLVAVANCVEGADALAEGPEPVDGVAL